MGRYSGSGRSCEAVCFAVGSAFPSWLTVTDPRPLRVPYSGASATAFHRLPVAVTRCGITTGLAAPLGLTKGRIARVVGDARPPCVGCSRLGQVGGEELDQGVGHVVAEGFLEHFLGGGEGGLVAVEVLAVEREHARDLRG